MDDELLEECGTEELYGAIVTLPQTVARARIPQIEHLYASKLRQIKNRLEGLHRTAPDEFYHRKKIIQQAIKEREKGQQQTMPELALEELKEVLKFTERLYRG